MATASRFYFFFLNAYTHKIIFLSKVKDITVAIHNIDGVSPSNGSVIGLAPYLLCVEMCNYLREENSTPMENSYTTFSTNSILVLLRFL